MGFEDEVEQSLPRPCHTCGRSKRTCELTSSTIPQRTPFHRLVELEFSPIELDPERPHAAASLVHLNSVPSVQMRCIITAKRRASATIAFFIPRCLAIFIAQALSQDHFAERNKHDLGSFIERCPHHLISAARDGARTITLARLVAGGRQSEYGPNRL